MLVVPGTAYPYSYHLRLSKLHVPSICRLWSLNKGNVSVVIWTSGATSCAHSTVFRSSSCQVHQATGCFQGWQWLLHFQQPESCHLHICMQEQPIHQGPKTSNTFTDMLSHAPIPDFLMSGGKKETSSCNRFQRAMPFAVLVEVGPLPISKQLFQVCLDLSAE